MASLAPIYRIVSSTYSSAQKVATKICNWLGRKITQIFCCSGSVAKTKDIAAEHFSPKPEGTASSPKNDKQPTPSPVPLELPFEVIGKINSLGKQLRDNRIILNYVATFEDAKTKFNEKSKNPGEEAFLFEIEGKFYVGTITNDKRFIYDSISPLTEDWTKCSWQHGVEQNKNIYSNILTLLNAYTGRKFV